MMCNDAKVTVDYDGAENLDCLPSSRIAGDQLAGDWLLLVFDSVFGDQPAAQGGREREALYRQS